jgi:DnaK suppressor protein
MLVVEKGRVLGNFERHVDDALADEDVLADEIDIAQRSSDQASQFRMADKERKLLIEIDAALEKMRTGEYGLCEGTDEPIGFKRLEIRPWTRYSVEYKEMLEREKAQQAR